MTETASPAPRSKATELLLESSGPSVERLPVLGAIFERVRASGTQALQHLSAAPLSLQLKGFSGGRIGGVLDAAEGSTVAAIFQSSAWESRILVGIRRNGLYAMLEAMLGADGSEPPVEERPFTSLERRVARVIAEHLAQALGRAFAPVSATSFEFERVETRMELAAIGRRDDSCVLARLQVETLERGGELFVMIPQRTLLPIRHALAHVEKAGPSSGSPFAQQMQKEVQRAQVSLKAVLEQRTMTLGEIAGLQVGQRLELQATPRSRVKVECNDQALFWCELGQANGAYTLRVEDFVDQEQEFIDDILPR